MIAKTLAVYVHPLFEYYSLQALQFALSSNTSKDVRKTLWALLSPFSIGKNQPRSKFEDLPFEFEPETFKTWNKHAVHSATVLNQLRNWGKLIR